MITLRLRPILTAAAACSILFLCAPSSYAAEETAQAGITLVDSSQVADFRYPGETNALIATFQNKGLATTGLLDLELKGSDGKTIKQSFWDNLMLGQDAYRTAILDSGVLPLGTYSWDVGIFEPAWSAVREWHTDLLSFTVGTSSPAKSNEATSTAATELRFPLSPTIHGESNGNLIITQIEKNTPSDRDTTIYMTSRGEKAWGTEVHLLLTNPWTNEVLLDSTSHNIDIPSEEPIPFGITVPPSFPEGTYGLKVWVTSGVNILNSIFDNVGTIAVR